jgi:hypothetical protein
MMKATLSIAAMVLLLTVSAAQGASRTGGDYEGYTGIPELDYPADDYSIFDEVRLHVGASFLNSLQEIMTSPGSKESVGLRGFDLNFGVDLFSINWIAEGHLINFPETSLGDTRVATNGFELRVLYDSAIREGMTLHGAVGLASRAYSVKTFGRPDTTFSSAASVLAFGGDYWISGQLSAGLELTTHLPMASGDDPSSVDLGIKVNGHF